MSVNLSYHCHSGEQLEVTMFERHHGHSERYWMCMEAKDMEITVHMDGLDGFEQLGNAILTYCKAQRLKAEKCQPAIARHQQTPPA